jgi:hypothetical protein
MSMRLHTFISNQLSPQPLGGSIWLIIMILFFISAKQLNGQMVEYSLQPSPQIVVCGEAEAFEVAFTNIQEQALSGITIEIALPTGINYLENSLQSISGPTVLESELSNLNVPVFSLPLLRPDSSVAFTIWIEADTEVIGHPSELRNTVHVSTSQDSQSLLSPAYDALYAALAITNISPLNTTVYSGEAYDRTLTVYNGGYGALSTFTIQDEHSDQLAIESTDQGVLNAQNGQIVLSADDFTAIGDGDGLFERNESITITQTINATGCEATGSTITALWSCGGPVLESNKKYPYTTIDVRQPDLQAISTATFDTCFDGAARVQRIQLTNTGNGVADSVRLTFKNTSLNAHSWMTSGSITVQFPDGHTESPSIAAIIPSPSYDCFAADAIAGATINLPAIAPNETYLIEWDQFICTDMPCQDIMIAGWDYQVVYADVCQANDYTISDTALPAIAKNFSLFVESPTDLVDGQTGLYSYLFTNASTSIPSSNDSYILAVVDIPQGMAWDPATVANWHSGSQQWPASHYEFDPANRKLQLFYDMPTAFELKRSVIDVQLTADCSALNTTGDVAVGLQLFLVADENCVPNYTIPLICKEEVLTKIHCPATCQEGMAFQSFGVQRVSLGAPDNNLDGLPDSNGQHELSKIKLNRVMAKDTFETHFQGTIHTLQANDSWAHVYAKSSIPNGQHINLLYAVLTVTRTGLTDLTAYSIPANTILNNGQLEATFDLSPASLASIGHASFDNYEYQEGDQLSLKAYYQLSGNIGGKVEQLRIENEFYAAHAPNGTKYQCEEWDGHLTMIGYYFANTNAEQYTVTDCEVSISQNFYLSIGNCCNNFAGGELFPYEYRQWAILDKVKVTIPEGYAYLTGRIQQRRTLAANTTTLETVDGITPSAYNAQELEFDIESLYASGSLTPSDDGFNGSISIVLDPNCEVNTAANLTVNWTMFFKESSFLGGQTTGGYTATPDYIKYRRGRLKVTTNQPTQEGLTEMASWDIKVKNNTNVSLKNGWLVPLSLDGRLIPVSCIALATGDTLELVNGFYQLGDFSKRQVKNYRITARQNSCTESELTIYTGYSCDGYPSSFDSFSCGYLTKTLNVIPLPAELQARTISHHDIATDCDSQVDFGLELLSAKLAAVKDIAVIISVPEDGSIRIMDSISLDYPGTGTITTVPLPAPVGNSYIIPVDSLAPALADSGLPGITDPNANTLALNLTANLEPNFVAGKYLHIEIQAYSACGDLLPSLFKAFDPNAAFSPIENSGLASDGDNWALAWGDYNNDGYDDLFITSYAPDKPNELYRNEGDGTFSPVLIPPFTTDIASSLAASWGDYDNDGDLDLFVANNIGSTNYLYRNEGSGFTKIANDPTVNDIGYAHGCSWVDYDNDGYLDLFVAQYFPTQFNQLFKNKGDGTFEADTDNAIALEADFSVAGIWGDFNNDRLPDLFVANTNNSPNSLYQNMGDGQFLKINDSPATTDVGNSVGGSWGDYDNDGDLDLFVSNAGDQANILYRNEGNAQFSPTGELSLGGHSHGSTWLDYDNDGWLDLFVGNDQGQGNYLYHNDRGQKFTLIDNEITQLRHSSFGLAWSDFDKNGSLDVLIANRANQPNTFFTNQRASCSNYLCITLEGRNSNRSAIGAMARLKANIHGQDIWQYRVIEGQSGGGVGGQNSQALHFGLGDAVKVDSLIIEWPSGHQQLISTNTINDCLNIIEEDATEICGRFFHDENNNCSYDDGEMLIPNARVLVQPGNQLFTTDEWGEYRAYLPVGQHSLSISSAHWINTCTDTFNIIIDNIGEQNCGYDFAAVPGCILPDLKIDLSMTANRVGMENLAAIVVKNEGTTMADSITLEMTLNDFSTIVASSIPWESYNGQRVTWKQYQLEVGESVTINLSLFIEGGTPVGLPLTNNVRASTTAGDCNDSDNVAAETVLSSGPIDPNDILVNPEGDIAPGQELAYKIRFQNVGSTTARFVRVENQLPPHLDLQALEIGAVSHAYQFRQQERKLIWEFPNINLPDSTANEADSHGFIVYRIRPLPNLPEGTTINNKASIFFEEQAPLITNTVSNRIVSKTEMDDQAAYFLSAYPNPTTSYITLSFEEEINKTIGSANLYNSQGNKVAQWPNIGLSQTTLFFADLPTGFYQLSVFDTSGFHYRFPVVITE